MICQDALTTKVRVVFDGSAQCDPGLPSLNDILETGPSTVPTIFDILFRFRSYKIPLVADIAQAFHQICVSSDDINCLRFLWVNDLNAVEPEFVFMRFLRVVFGLHSSPFLLGETLQYLNIKRYQPDDPTFVDKLLKSLYVDDLISGSNSIKEAFELFLKSKACLSEASFHLRKWVSSGKELMSLIQMSEATQAHDNPVQSRVVEDQSTFAKLSIGQLETLDGGESKVLGHLWNRSEDTFIFKFDKLVKIAQALSATKRNVLKVAASVYDPLGILSPIVVKMKVLLQEACHLQYVWDTPLPDELARIWRKWIDDLEKIRSIVIPRSYFYRIEVEIVSHALHGFADASLIGYCSVVYLVYRTVANMYFSELVCSKSKVNPVVKLTLRKLELLAALILARLMNTIKKSLSDEIPHFEQVICWGDNTSALFWIKSTKSHEYKQYVRNRVDEILDLTDRNMWRYCPTGCNPAYVGSRGQFPSELKRNFLWLNGPSWLFGPPENYPVDLSVSQLEVAEENIASLKLRSKSTSVLLSVPDEKSFPSISAVIDASSYSSYHQLLNVTLYVLRLINNLKARIKKDINNIMCGRITVEEIKAVEILWLFDTQKHFRSLESFKKVEQSLGVYVDDDGLFRCHGRLGNAPVPEESKFPILLPRDIYVTDLIV